MLGRATTVPSLCLLRHMHARQANGIGCAHLWVFEVLPRLLSRPTLVQDAAQREDVHLHEQEPGGGGGGGSLAADAQVYALLFLAHVDIAARSSWKWLVVSVLKPKLPGELLGSDLFVGHIKVDSARVDSAWVASLWSEASVQRTQRSVI